MMLFVPPGQAVRSPTGLGVAHVTLHTSVASVPGLLTTDGSCRQDFAASTTFSCESEWSPRGSACVPSIRMRAKRACSGTKNGGSFGPRSTGLAPQGWTIQGPIPADALIRRAIAGEFDGVVAMYHDQGHIPIKLVARDMAVNITLGLPIVRTSPSHGTAFDIAGKGTANPEGMIEAIRMASLLARTRSEVGTAF